MLTPIHEVLQHLVHRYPMLLVDRITELRKGESISGYKNVSINEPYFQGHFPGNPIMPGVLIVEAMAQLSGVLAFETKEIRPERDKYLLYLTGVDKTRFKSPVIPGDRLDLRSEVIAQRNDTMNFLCTAHVKDRLVCTSRLLCSGQPV